MTKPIRIAVIIPFYNEIEIVDSCISSIFSSSIVVTKIFLVDNSSIVSKIDEKYKNEPRVNVIKTKPSIGFGRACNIGINEAFLANCNIGIIMNQDAIFDHDTIEILAEQTLSPYTFATVPISFLYDFSAIHPRIIQGYLQPVKGYMNDKNRGQLQTKYELSFLQTNGSCVAFNLNSIKDKAWFDPIFHMYGEDVELFKRLTEHDNLSIFLVPKARIGHIHSALTDLKNKEKITTSGRFGWQVIYLKNRKATKFFIKTFHTYFLALKILKFSLIWKYFLSDCSLILKIPTILKSRNSDFLIKRIQHFIQNDQYGH